MRFCPSCGFPLDRHNLPAVCPKCDEDLIRAKARKPLAVDLAHGGETVSQALAKLDKAVSECVWHGHPSLMVIHGQGSGGGSSRIKPQVLAALQKHAERLGAVMEQDGDNPGAHVLRFK
jgi:DhnA family fructose-bisphosphate aldolase class Ia